MDFTREQRDAARKIGGVAGEFGDVMESLEKGMRYVEENYQVNSDGVRTRS